MIQVQAFHIKKLANYITKSFFLLLFVLINSGLFLGANLKDLKIQSKYFFMIQFKSILLNINSLDFMYIITTIFKLFFYAYFSNAN